MNEYKPSMGGHEVHISINDPENPGKTTEKVKINAEQALLRRVIETHQPGDWGSIPRIVRAMRMIGSFNEIPVRKVNVLDHEGQSHSMTEPTDAIFIGEAAKRDQLEFIFRTVRKMTPGPATSTDSPEKQAILNIWQSKAVTLNQAELTYLNEINRFRSECKRHTYLIDGEREKFKRGEGTTWNHYQQGVERYSKETLAHIQNILKLTESELAAVVPEYLR